jgi:hypothetical protein
MTPGAAEGIAIAKSETRKGTDMGVFETIGLFFVLFMTLLGAAAFGYCAWVGAQKLRQDVTRGQRDPRFAGAD